MNKYLLSLVLMMAGFAGAQTTTYTGVIRDLSNNAVTSGQVTFALTPSSDSTISGTARFTPVVIACNINGDGTLSGYVGGVVSGPCVVASNTALMPSGTAYRVCVQPQFATPGSCFYDYATTASKDISTVLPTLTTGPINYALNGAVLLGASVSQNVIQAVGTTLAVNSLNTTEINVDLFQGADIGAKIAAAQTNLGTIRAVLTVNTAGTLSTAVTLAAGNDLRINAPITTAALVTLGGLNHVSCSGAGSITTAGGVFTSTANNLFLTGCTVTGGGADFKVLTTVNSSNVKVWNNITNSIGMLYTQFGSNVQATGNTVSWPSGSPQGYGVVWGSTNYVLVTDNIFTNVSEGVEFFNGDADPNHGSTATSRAGVLAFSGHYLISNNSCTNSGACYWGSAGHDIVMSGNYASGCGDVCYDLEGSIDALVVGNRGDTANNGIGTTFFFSDHVSFIGNEFSSNNGTPLIAVHNSSLAPAFDEFLTVKNNVLSCFGAVCQAVGGDPAGDVNIEGNRITSGIINFASYGGNTTIKRNELTFSLAGASAITAINTPNLVNGALMQIEDNTVSGVAQPAGSACISNYSADYNSVVTLQISHNRCFGGFPIDLNTTNAGTNGGTGVVTIMAENWWGSNNVLHTHTTGNYDNYQEVSRFSLVGSTWTQTRNQIAVNSGTQGVAGSFTGSASGNTAILLSNTSPGGRSWAALVTGSNEPATGVGDLSLVDLTNSFNYGLRLHTLNGNAGYDEIGGAMGYTWSPGSAENLAPDTGLYRVQANVLALGNGTQNDSSGSLALFGHLGPATAPTGSCAAYTPGTWVFSRDGHGTVCLGTTWTSKI